LNRWGRFEILNALLTLYSYPALFGVADNNGYGLKVFAFLKLAGVPFVHRHTFDASQAPRQQLPYIIDDGETVGDSDTIIAHLIRRYGLTIDAALSAPQRDTVHLIGRMLDDLYWVMSYSRWKDEEFWPAFRDALRREHPQVTDQALDKAREYNSQRYYYQGIGRFTPAAAYARGLADLQVLVDLLPPGEYMFGPKPTSVDAAIYGFIANIYFYSIETPLKKFVSSHSNLMRHCTAIHRLVHSNPPPSAPESSAGNPSKGGPSRPE
jgi:glutathione S-transferase